MVSAALAMGARSMDGAAEIERTGLRSPVLVLNRSYQPVRITDAKHGFSMLYLGRASALDHTYEPHDFHAWAAREPGDEDEAIGTPTGRVCIPRILLLLDYNRVPRAPLRLSRRHVYMRDEYTCQYCGIRPGVKELNLDHVVPRSRGALHLGEPRHLLPHLQSSEGVGDAGGVRDAPVQAPRASELEHGVVVGRPAAALPRVGAVLGGGAAARPGRVGRAARRLRLPGRADTEPARR